MIKLIKLLVVLTLFIPSMALGDCYRKAKYGEAYTLNFSVYEVDGIDLRTDWIPAATDCNLYGDEGASEQCDNAATISDLGDTYALTLSVAEMTHARVMVRFVDSATKVFLDTTCVVETYGNASAQHAFDLDTATPDVNVATIDASAITAASIATDAIGAAEIAADAIGASEIATAAIVAGTELSGTVASNVTQIDGNATNGNNATLYLKQLDISNSAGTAVKMVSSGSNGNGMTITGNGSGSAMSLTAGATGHGFFSTSSSGTGYAFYATNSNGDAGRFFSSGGNGDGLQAIGNGAGSGFDGRGGATAHGMELEGGATSGSALYLNPVNGSPILYDATELLTAINAEVDTSLSDIKLDHLIAVADADDPVDGSIIAEMVDNTATADWSNYSHTNASSTALRARGDSAWVTGAGGSSPDVLVSTTIATLSTQVSWTLTAGSTDDDAYNGAIVVIEDASTSTQKAIGVISDYTGSTKTITLLNDPGVFTIATTDNVDIIADRSIKPTTDNRTVDVALGGEVGVNLDNITGTLDASEIGTDAIGAAEIATSAIGADEIAASAIGASEIATDAIGAAEIATAAIGSDEIGSAAIGADEIAADAIGASEIANDAIDAAAIATAAIGSNEMATDSIGAAELAADALAEINTEVDTGITDSGIKADTAAILIDTAEIGTAGAGLTNITWNASWDAEVQSECADAINADTGDTFTAVPWNSAWDAEVQSEVDDSLGAARTELSAVPGASPDLIEMIQWVYQRAKHRENQTSTTTTLYQDDGTTALGTSTVSDNGTTFERGEFN